jgi:hypothetical protein
MQRATPAKRKEIIKKFFLPIFLLSIKKAIIMGAGSSVNVAINRSDKESGLSLSEELDVLLILSRVLGSRNTMPK